MSKRHDVIGNPSAARRRGLVLVVDGDRMLVQYHDGTQAWEPTPHELKDRPRPVERSLLPHEAIRFEHVSERQFAMLMDFYEIDWMYRPRTFNLSTAAAVGGPGEFAPDFYLPAFELYIQIAPEVRELSDEAHRGVRRLTEEHPEVKCKLLHQREYLKLLEKYELADTPHPPAYGFAEKAKDSGPTEAERAAFEALITAA